MRYYHRNLAPGHLNVPTIGATILDTRERFSPPPIISYYRISLTDCATAGTLPAAAKTQRL